jgi:hypothetical protein
VRQGPARAAGLAARLSGRVTASAGQRTAVALNGNVHLARLKHLL